MSPRTPTLPRAAVVASQDRAYLDKLHEEHCPVCAAPPGTDPAALHKVKVPDAAHYVAGLVARFAPDARPVGPAPLPKLLRAVRGEGS